MAASEIDLSLNHLYRTATSTAAKSRLRVGVMLEALSVPRHVDAVLADIEACDFADLTAVSVKHTDPEPARLSWSGDRVPWVLKQYHRWIDRRGSRIPDPFALVDARTRLAGATITNPGGVHPDVDLWLCLSGNPPQAGESRLGTWVTRYGAAEQTDASAALLADFAAGATLFPVRIDCVRGDAAATPVARVVSSTHSRSTIADNVASVIWSAQNLYIRALHDLLTEGESDHPGPADARRSAPAPTDRTEGTTLPSVQWVLRTVTDRVYRRARRAWRGIEWQVAIRRSAGAAFARPPGQPLPDFRWLRAEAGHFWADPFLFETQGRTWLFYEDYPYSRGSAVISCGVLGDDGTLRETRRVLERPYHLSYPCVFTGEGAIWMIPETNEAGQVQLYRCVDFPDTWVLEKTLLTLRATDPTILFRGGRWWLWLSPMPVKGQTATTLLYSSTSLTGEWTETTSSPVSVNARYARCAGHIIEHDGRLIRPSQDCSRAYGYALNFNRVDVLSVQRYEETPMGVILPRDIGGVQRVHTYNRVRDWEVVDGFRYCKASNAEEAG